MSWRWSAPWLDSRLNGICADPAVVLLGSAAVLSEMAQATAQALDEALLYGWRQRLRDEGWSGWLLDLDTPVRLAPARVRASKGKKRRRR